MNNTTPALNATNLNRLQQNVEDEINLKDNKVGDLSNLQTEDKTNVVNAINELLTDVNTIIESGSNSNGSWIKYSDGTMICWKHFTTTDQAIDNQYGSLYQKTRNVSFPQTFVSAPVGICSQFQWGTGATWGSVMSTNVSSMVLRAFDAFSRAAGTNCEIGWMAIGRWK